MGRLLVFCGAPGTGSNSILLLGSGIVRAGAVGFCANVELDSTRQAVRTVEQEQMLGNEYVTTHPPYQIVRSLYGMGDWIQQIFNLETAQNSRFHECSHRQESPN
ncbi:MAG TPA: hypothetical protein VND66_08700 [Acidobacteriaceae bacterium]|nr:hypothetical protein [Acidobacteriaceae bacterium]